MFGDSSNSPDTALQPFEPDASSVYPIETVATRSDPFDVLTVAQFFWFVRFRRSSRISQFFHW
jgi:hypothetical protein